MNPVKRAVAPLLLVLSAPSGAGKTTVGRGLLASVPGLERAVTCTTRGPRTGERDGVDYHFLDRAEFERRVAAGAFLEHAEVYGNRYGTLREEVAARLRAGRDVLLTVDVQGAESIRAAAGEDSALRSALVSVFLLPPSMGELERRLTGRNQDAAAVIARRLAVAREEMDHWRHFDYVVVSGGVEDDLAAMRGIILAERQRSARVVSLEMG